MDAIESSQSSSTEDTVDQRSFGPTEFGIVKADDKSRRMQGVALMVIGAMGMIVGIMGLLGKNVFDRDRR